jgi:hypothetical protein
MIRSSSISHLHSLQDIVLLITAVGWNAFIIYVMYTAVRDGVLLSFTGLSLLPLLVAGVVLFHFALDAAESVLYPSRRLR